MFYSVNNGRNDFLWFKQLYEIGSGDTPILSGPSGCPRRRMDKGYGLSSQAQAKMNRPGISAISQRNRPRESMVPNKLSVFEQ